VNAVTYTDASPTVAELYPKILDGVQQIQTSFFGGPNVIFMHPRRLAFILAAVDSTNRPLAVPTAQGPQNAFAAGSGAVVYGNSGYTIAGLPVSLMPMFQPTVQVRTRMSSSLVTPKKPTVGTGCW
jgi:hypothetical protein